MTDTPRLSEADLTAARRTPVYHSVRCNEHRTLGGLPCSCGANKTAALIHALVNDLRGARAEIERYRAAMIVSVPEVIGGGTLCLGCDGTAEQHTWNCWVKRLLEPAAALPADAGTTEGHP